MRDAIAPWEGTRRTFDATFKHIGTKQGVFGGYAPTALLVDLVDSATGAPVADHVWVNVVKDLRTLPHDARIRFRATIAPYYKSQGADFGLKYLRNVRTAQNEEGHP